MSFWRAWDIAEAVGKTSLKNRGPEGRVGPDDPLFPVIEEAYRVFRRDAPPDPCVCDCCMEPDIRRDFFAHGQRDLPFHYLRDWFFAVADPDLPKAVWAYLLPRVFDAMASGEDPASVGVEVSLSRFPTGDRTRWSDEEWAAIERFRVAYLDCAATPGDAYLDDALCTFGSAGWNVEDLFAQVFAWPTDRLATRLWADWAEHGRPSVWINAFWPDGAVPMRFYASEALHDRMVAFGMDERADPKTAERALAVADVIYAARTGASAP